MITFKHDCVIIYKFTAYPKAKTSAAMVASLLTESPVGSLQYNTASSGVKRVALLLGRSALVGGEVERCTLGVAQLFVVLSGGCG